MAKTKLIIGIIITFIIIFGFIMLNNSKSTTSKATSDMQLTGETKEFTIEAFQYGFNPSTIEVNKGDKVKITAYSIDTPHGLGLFEFDINLYLADSTPKIAEFIADKKGVFRFYCSVPCGAGHSTMNGQLIVH